MKLTDLSKEELIEEIKKLKSRKKYGLVWEEKLEDVVEDCKKKLPILEEVREKAIDSDANLPTNLIIEGDNYHALSVLNYTHQGKIDVIYIDPPYNTGASDWKYNNRFVDSNDNFRHSKWIAFMYKRLYLTKNLLKKNGVLCVTIDNYEIHNLRHILDEVFPDKDIVITVIVHNFRGRAKNNFALTHEYAIWVLPKDIESITRKSELAKDAVLNLKRTGQNSLRQDRPTMFYGIMVNKKNLQIVGVTDAIKKDAKYQFSKDKNILTIYPIDKGKIERRWYYGSLKVMTEAKNGNVFAKMNKNKIDIYFKLLGKPIRRKSILLGPEYDSSANGTVLLTNIIGNNDFSFPKSLYAVKECIESASSDKEAIILDFFAGSGTTGHAVLLLNKKDGGKRQFILCTNNENKIAEEVCYPRIKKVINGVKGFNDITNISANLKYFKTSFVSKSKVSDDTRTSLVRKSVEMICVREDTYNKVLNKEQYKIYRNNRLCTGLLFNLDGIEDFKKVLIKLNIPAHIYVFSLTNDTYSSDFEDLKVKYKLCPIPESILEVYRKLFKE